MACVKFVVFVKKDEENKGRSNYINARIGGKRRLEGRSKVVAMSSI